MEIPQLAIFGAPIPESMGRCADLYHDVRELRLAVDKQAKALKARESELAEHMINGLSSSDDTGAAGLRYRVQITKVVKYTLAAGDGWNALCAYVQQSGRFDLLQKRLSETAVKDIDEQTAMLPPGVERIKVPDISITKI